MQVGITGHQTRKGIDWSWVADTLQIELSKLGPIDRALSSLAAGSDQTFTEVALALGIPVLAVIPISDYEKYFKGGDLTRYRYLLAQCDVVHLNLSGDDELAFLQAGKKIVAESDIIFSVWDGKQAEGRGGTGDIVRFAQQKKKRVLHINPITRTVRII